MGERIRAFDWASHPLGEPAHWPPALRMALSLCLNSSFPTAIYWGPQLYLLYNDAWSEIPADKHPRILGMPGREAWDDIWHVVGPEFGHVMRTGEGRALYEQMLPMVRGGQPRETWWNYSLTAIREADHSVAGIFNQGNEITELVKARRERQAEIERWRALFQQAPAPVALLGGPGHVFEFANEAYLALVGERDILGKPVAQALPEVAEQGFVTLLDGVFTSGRPYIGRSITVKLAQRPGQAPSDRVLDFIYQPVRDGGGEITGIFVLVNDVTERAQAESALRLSNWQLGEERARLGALVEAEQRAQTALRRFNDTLEAQVRQRTQALTRALEAQNEAAARLRATFHTGLIYQGFLDVDGVLLDANPTSLAGIGRSLEEVVGRPFWETPWFTATPGLPEAVREAVTTARRGEAVTRVFEVNLPTRRQTFEFHLRPAFDAQGRVIGLVPEALEIPGAGPTA
jgi:PAS domain S-box-containing protein